MLSRMLTVREQIVLAGLALALLVGAGVLAFGGNAAAPEDAAIDAALNLAPEAPAAILPPRKTIPKPEPPALQAPEPPPVTIAVAVKGEVAKPGLYYLEVGQRIQDLLKEAGGLSDAGDDSYLNLAAKLIDGTTLVVPNQAQMRAGFPWYHAGLNPPEYLIGARPAAQPSATASGGAAQAANTPALVDLNHATQAELETLPGIGPALAGRIIAHRGSQPFRSVEELDEVSGIGEKRLESLRPLVTVR